MLVAVMIGKPITQKQQSLPREKNINLANSRTHYAINSNDIHNEKLVIISHGTQILLLISHSAFTLPNLTTETLEQGVKYVQN